MRVTVGSRTERGSAIDLTGAGVDGKRLQAAMRGDATTTQDGRRLSVACLEPGPVHDRCGYVHPESGVRVRTAVAAAARSRGLSAPQDDRIREVSDELAAFETGEGGANTNARRRRAAVDGEIERVRERVAELRGKLTAAREAGRDTEELVARLRAATRELSEVETEAAAAREALERARERARATRDRRDRRRRLEDERANLRRRARAHLVDELRTEFAAAVASVPAADAAAVTVAEGRTADADTTTGERRAPEDPFDVDAVTAALAVCRIARLHTPVVLACDRFPDAETAAVWLDAPVVVVA